MNKTNLEVAKEFEPLENFTESQWWIAELDSLRDSGNLSDDQKRAVAVVHNLLRSASYTSRICAEKDAEIARLRDGWFLAESNLNAAKDKIAMQAEKIPAAMKRAFEYGAKDYGSCLQQEITELLSISAESVAEWKAKKLNKVRVDGYEKGYLKCMEDNFVGADDAAEIHANGRREALKELEPLQRQVAMLHDAVEKVAGEMTVGQRYSDYGVSVLEAVEATQATAEAYDREHAAKVLEEVKSGLFGSSYDCADYIQRKIAELRAQSAQKKEGE